jgi:hypothetical protein
MSTTILTKIRSIGRPIGRQFQKLSVSPKKFLLIRRLSFRKGKDGLFRSHPDCQLGKEVSYEDEIFEIFPHDSLSIVAYASDDDDDDDDGNECHILDEVLDAELVHTDEVVNSAGTKVQPSSQQQDFETPRRNNNSIRRRSLGFLRLRDRHHDGHRRRQRQQQNRERGFGSSVGKEAARVLSDTVEDTMEFVEQRLVPTAMDATKDVAKYVIPSMRDALNETLQECVRDLGAAFIDSSAELGTSVQVLGESVEIAMNDVGNILGTSIVSEGRRTAEVFAEESKEWRRLVATVAEKTIRVIFDELRVWMQDCFVVPFMHFILTVLTPICLLVAADLYGKGGTVRNETRIFVLILILAHWWHQHHRKL